MQCGVRVSGPTDDEQHPDPGSSATEPCCSSVCSAADMRQRSSIAESTCSQHTKWHSAKLPHAFSATDSRPRPRLSTIQHQPIPSQHAHINHPRQGAAPARRRLLPGHNPLQKHASPRDRPGRHGIPPLTPHPRSSHPQKLTPTVQTLPIPRPRRPTRPRVPRHERRAGAA